MNDPGNIETQAIVCSDTDYVMNKVTARNILLTLGAWSISGILAWLFSFLIPVGVLTFRGDLGSVFLWIWLGVPHLLAAILAANALVWATDTRRPFSWLLGLAALFLYSESIHAWRQLIRPWHEPPGVPDYVGIAIAAIIPVLACLAIGIWWNKHLASRDLHSDRLPRS